MMNLQSIFRWAGLLSAPPAIAAALILLTAVPADAQRIGPKPVVYNPRLPSIGGSPTRFIDSSLARRPPTLAELVRAQEKPTVGPTPYISPQPIVPSGSGGPVNGNSSMVAHARAQISAFELQLKEQVPNPFVRDHGSATSFHSLP
jgi:hypothetical protein